MAAQRGPTPDAVVDRLLAAGAAVDKVNNNQRSKPQRPKMSAARRQGAGLLSLLLHSPPALRLSSWIWTSLQCGQNF
jgi:hypothetical protein